MISPVSRSLTEVILSSEEMDKLHFEDPLLRWQPILNLFSIRFMDNVVMDNVVIK